MGYHVEAKGTPDDPSTHSIQAKNKKQAGRSMAFYKAVGMIPISHEVTGHSTTPGCPTCGK